MLKLAHPLFGERMVRVLGLRLGSLFESAGGALDLWSKSALSQLDAQWQERNHSLARRIEVFDRMGQVPEDGAQCMAQAQLALQQLSEQEQRLQDWMQRLLQSPAMQAARGDEHTQAMA